jgi:bacterioferritin-associated ferredoxin
MYVCICNALTDSQIAEASRKGARTVREAYAFFGVEINCGQCKCTAQEIINEAEPAYFLQAAE